MEFRRILLRVGTRQRRTPSPRYWRSGSLLQSAPSFLKLRNLLHRIQTASQNQGSDRQQPQKSQNSKFTHPQPLNTLSDLRPATFDLGLSTGPKGSPNFTFVTSTLRRRNHGAHRASLAGRIPDDEPDLDWFNRPRNPSESDQDCFDQSQVWKPEEIPLGDGRTLVLDDT